MSAICHAKRTITCLMNDFHNDKSNFMAKEKQMEQLRQAIAFLVHFVGDIHQPLHVGQREDAGGNAISVQILPGPPPNSKSPETSSGTSSPNTNFPHLTPFSSQTNLHQVREVKALLIYVNYFRPNLGLIILILIVTLKSYCYCT